MPYENILGAEERPRFFSVHDPGSLGFEAPPVRRDMALRTFVRSLAGMQKEAFVVSDAGDRAWRLVSDEGPALEGHQEAPVPLAFLTAGLVASYTEQMLRLAEKRGIVFDRLRLTVRNFYTTEGSALRGTMVSGALNPELHVEAGTSAGQGELLGLCADAVRMSPMNGLVRGANTSLFTLTRNGEEVDAGLTGLEHVAEPDVTRLDELPVHGPHGAAELIRRLPDVAPDDPTKDAGSYGLRDDRPKRTLIVRGSCVISDDGVKVIDVHNAHRTSPVWRFLSDEAVHLGGRGLAPDAATLASAGIGFCFMTQLGRYATVARYSLAQYRVTQDTHFSAGGGGAMTDSGGEADGVETHVYLDTDESEESARTLLRMGRQTCYLHALCETDLKVKLKATVDTL